MYKKPTLTLSRNHYYCFLLGSLLLPAVVIACFAAEVKGVFFVALLAMLFSGGVAWYLLQLWDMKMQRSVSELVKKRVDQIHLPSSSDALNHLKAQLHRERRGYEHQMDLLQSSAAKSKEEVHQLNLEMDKKLEEMRLAYLEFEDLRKEYDRLEKENQEVKKENQKQLKHKESLCSEYQRTIAEQRSIIEKKHYYIGQLEGKVSDLMYEIRSLLQLEKNPSRPPKAPVQDYLPSKKTPNTPYDFSLHLQRFIEKAESQTGMEHLGGKSPRFLNLSDSYAVDRRRLFDSLRDETLGVIFILALAEKKFLFVNQHVKVCLGWNSEKFIQEFPRLITKGYPEWKKALTNISQVRECQTKLVIQSKSGQSKEYGCTMGLITKGPFTNHVMGILA